MDQNLISSFVFMQSGTISFKVDCFKTQKYSELFNSTLIYTSIFSHGLQRLILKPKSYNEYK